VPEVQVAGGTLHFETLGSTGDPTVFVHGSWSDRSTWGRLCGPLSGALRVLLYDRRGHGSSSDRPTTGPVRADAADLAALLEGTDLFPAHVVGVGYGAAVAFRVALDRPELVRSVAAHDPPFAAWRPKADPPPSDGARTHEELDALRRRVRSGDAEGAARAYVERFAPELGPWAALGPSERAGRAREARAWAAESTDPDALGPDRPELATLDLPVLLTTGESSGPESLAILEELERTLRNRVARTIPGTGSSPQVTDAETYAGVLSVFLLERDVPPA